MDYRNRDELKALIESCEGRLRESARQSGIPYGTLQKWAKKHGLMVNASNRAKSEAAIGIPINTPVSIKGLLLSTDEPVTEEYILRKLQMSDAEWMVTGVDIKEYDGYAEGGGEREMYWAQVKLRRRVDTSRLDELLAALPGERGLREGRVPGKTGKAACWDIVYSDPHFPNDEPTITTGFLKFISDHSDMIRSINILGDGMDSSAFKRHRKNRRTDTNINDDLTAFHGFLDDIVTLLPTAAVRLIWGNHDVWVYQRILEVLPELLEIKLPATGEQFFTIERILGLDELGIEIVTGDGEYHDTTIELHPDLIGFHGTKTGKNGGAVNAINTWEASVFQGHDHKTAMIGRTRRVRNSVVLRLAISVGATCKPDQGYSDTHDVGQSWLVVSDHGSGVWNPEYAIYWPQHDTVTFRDWSFKG